MPSLAQAWWMTTHLGPGWVCFRVRYALRRRAGFLRRRTPLRTWEQVMAPKLESLGWVPPAPQAIGPDAVQEAEEVLQGTFRLFSWQRVAAGFPPDWRRNQLTGEQVPGDRHWSALGDFAFGDIKGVWELSRFPWAFALARAYAKTGEERFAEGYWQLFEHWLQANPPNAGPNWMCGQEASFRLMGAAFAQAVLAKSPASRPPRIAAFARLVVATAERIAANLDYAESQANNHGISEALGLITAARLVPEHPGATDWRERGLRSLRDQLAELVYADGGFSQHSVVYHRVLLHDLLWVTAVLGPVAVHGWLRAAGLRATRFLDALVTPETGVAPLYGSNDGANVLPLADGAFLDFRPVIQAAYAVFAGSRRYEPGPWDEAAAWLTGAPLTAQAGVLSERQGPESTLPYRHFPNAGCVVWRRGDARVFFRCPSRFRHRPAQADLLHVDLEWRSQPIAIDAGSYSYNTAGPFAGALKEAAVHSCVTFDGEEPLRKAGRFLYLPWPTGSTRGEESQFTAETDAWRSRGIRHRRTIRPAGAEAFEVCDQIETAGPRRVRLHWLLADYPYEWEPGTAQLILQTPAGPYAVRFPSPPADFSVVRAERGTNRGWWAPHYHQAVPALSVAGEFSLAGPVELVTHFAPV